MNNSIGLAFVLSYFLILGCTINQPYSEFSQHEKDINRPENLSDKDFQILRFSLKDTAFFKTVADGSLIHLMATTCRPCVKKLLLLDSLQSNLTTKVYNFNADDWSMNQNIIRVFAKTTFKSVYVFEHSEFDQSFSNKERIIQFQNIVCNQCEFECYYFIGFRQDGRLQLFSDEEAVSAYLDKYLVVPIENRVKVFEVLKNASYIKKQT